MAAHPLILALCSDCKGPVRAAEAGHEASRLLLLRSKWKEEGENEHGMPMDACWKREADAGKRTSTK